MIVPDTTANSVEHNALKAVIIAHWPVPVWRSCKMWHDLFCQYHISRYQVGSAQLGWWHVWFHFFAKIIALKIFLQRFKRCKWMLFKYWRFHIGGNVWDNPIQVLFFKTLARALIINYSVKIPEKINYCRLGLVCVALGKRAVALTGWRQLLRAYI